MAILSRAARLVGRHWPFVALMTAGVTLRVLAWFAYQPALFFGDSFRYLGNVGTYDPAGLAPIGYELFVLTPALAVDGLELVAALQHLAGVGSAIALYALALRLGANRWLAALAAAPLLLDGYQIQIEQLIMSDIWQQVLLVALLWVLLGTGAPSPRRAALAGLLLGVAVMLRLVAISLVLPAMCYLIIAGGAWRLWRSWPGWRTIGARTLAFAAAFGVVIAGYGWYFHAQTGEWGLTRTTANVLYGRTAVVADCDRLTLDRLTALACPKEPLGQRRKLDDYAHIQREAPFRERFPPHTDLNTVQREFGRAVIAQQPLDVARAIGLDFLKGFRPTRTDAPGDTSVTRWQFKAEYPTVDLKYSTERFPRVQRTRPGRRGRARRVSPRVPAQRGLHPRPLAGCVRRGRAAWRVRRRPRQNERPALSHATCGRHGRDHPACVGSVRVLVALPTARPRAAAVRGRARDHRLAAAASCLDGPVICRESRAARSHSSSTPESSRIKRAAT